MNIFQGKKPTKPLNFGTVGRSNASNHEANELIVC